MAYVLEFGCSHVIIKYTLYSIIVTCTHIQCTTYSALQSASPFTGFPQNSPPTDWHCDGRRRDSHPGEEQQRRQRATITE